MRPFLMYKLLLLEIKEQELFYLSNALQKQNCHLNNLLNCLCGLNCHNLKPTLFSYFYTKYLSNERREKETAKRKNQYRTG